MASASSFAQTIVPFKRNGQICCEAASLKFQANGAKRKLVSGFRRRWLSLADWMQAVR